MKRRIFRRVFVFYFIVLFLSIIFINSYLTSVIRNNYIDELNKSLAFQTSLISGIINVSSMTEIRKFCRTIKEKISARVTVIDTEGKVLGDSDRDASMMDNHADRPEFQQALTAQTGSSIRFSNTLKYDLLYSARKIEQDGKHIGFIRLAVPLIQVNESINSLRLRINLAVILAFLLFGILLIWQTERIRKYVIKIADYAGALSRGLFDNKLYLVRAGEFTELAKDLNRMAAELEYSIKTKEEETNRLNVIIKSIPDALLLINVDGVIELSNRASIDLFGQERIDGRPFIEVVRSPAFLTLIDDVRQGLTPGSAELVFDFPAEKYLSVRVSPLYYRAGELAGFVAIFHDTTQMKKLEQMRKDFVANVSHEIRTPITAIKGFAETLIDGALYDKENAEKFLTTIISHSERLNRLVEDLMTISKLELGVISISKSVFEIETVIDEAIHTSAVLAAEKEIDIKKSLKAGDTRINADRDRVEQILLNLIENALKFTDEGEIEVGVDRDDEKKYLYVKDSGAGVPQKYLPRLGERFFRVDTSRSRDLGGTGLGLAIVKHIVRAHGWEMEIESEEGKGTVVKVFY